MTETERLRQAVWFADEHARGVPGHTPQRHEDAGGLTQYRCDTCRFDTGVTWEEFCTQGGTNARAGTAITATRKTRTEP